MDDWAILEVRRRSDHVIISISEVEVALDQDQAKDLIGFLQSLDRPEAQRTLRLATSNGILNISNMASYIDLEFIMDSGNRTGAQNHMLDKGTVGELVEGLRLASEDAFGTTSCS